MAASGNRPSVGAEMGFALLMDLYDQGRGLDTDSKIKAITRFLTVSDPGVEKQIKWSWVSKADKANAIVDVLRWGLQQFSEDKPFLRSGPSPNTIFGALAEFSETSGKFQDGIVWDRSHGRAVRVGSPDPAHLFLTRVFELLTEVAPWLRVCQRDECKRFFLYQRPKQIYCSEQCAQRVRMARFLSQRAPARSGKR